MKRDTLSFLIAACLLAFGEGSSSHSASLRVGERNAHRQNAEDPIQPYILAQINALNADGASMSTRRSAIAMLGRYPNRHYVVAELIHWLEFRMYQSRRTSFNSECNDGLTSSERYPAIGALARLGPFAAPQLVGEYVFFFENESLEDRRSRRYSVVEWNSATRKPFPTQSPVHRLSLIVVALCQRRDMASAAVEYALSLMPHYPRDSRELRACRALIGHIVAQYGEDERRRMFPPSAFQLDT